PPVSVPAGAQDAVVPQPPAQTNPPAQAPPAQSPPAAAATANPQPTTAPSPDAAGGAAPAPRPRVVICVGAGGTPEYARQFATWAERWRQATQQAGSDCVLVGLDPENPAQPDRDLLREALTITDATRGHPLWVVLLGHGTYDGRTPRFNLRGPDLSAQELSEWLTPWPGEVACLVCASSSAPFLKALAGPRRVVISATRGGSESSFARLGGELSAAILDRAADLDKDDQVSLLEAWLLAAARVREFYAQEGRLATEHALLDDNGDGLGTPAEWFTGVIATRTPKGGARADGDLARRWVLRPAATEHQLTATQRARRDELETQLADWRSRRDDLAEEAYWEAIEPVLIELSRLALSAPLRSGADEEAKPPAGSPPATARDAAPTPSPPQPPPPR
ncbi:MAG: hypothetical protein ACKOGA_09770, partial [Planctomycetaceae bacterium]